MKGIKLCGECADYDKKKHRCKRGASREDDPRNTFYDDCPLPDVAPVVHGEWEYYTHTMMACSICKRHVPRHKSEYCPHCGAKMKEVK